MLFFVIRHHSSISIISDEPKRAMLAFLVQEAGEDIWSEMPFSYNGATVHINCNSDADGGHGATNILSHLPLHAAAAEGNQAILDFFLTECL